MDLINQRFNELERRIKTLEDILNPSNDDIYDLEISPFGKDKIKWHEYDPYNTPDILRGITEMDEIYMITISAMKLRNVIQILNIFLSNPLTIKQFFNSFQLMNNDEKIKYEFNENGYNINTMFEDCKKLDVDLSATYDVLDGNILLINNNIILGHITI